MLIEPAERVRDYHTTHLLTPLRRGQWRGSRGRRERFTSFFIFAIVAGAAGGILDNSSAGLRCASRGFLNHTVVVVP